MVINSTNLITTDKNNTKFFLLEKKSALRFNNKGLV